MAKKKESKIELEPDETVAAAYIQAADLTEAVKNVVPMSDMRALCETFMDALKAEGLTVNADDPTATQVTIGEDFVDDIAANVPAAVGMWPSYPVWNFTATMYAVVPKGDYTQTRLEIIKQMVRDALVKTLNMGEPKEFNVSTVITDEKNQRGTGVRMSAMSLLVTIERIKKIRRA